MSGLFGSLYTGVSGMNVNQNSLNVTGHNLVNVDTEGYVRQQIVNSDRIYNTIGYSSISYKQIGTGVMISAVRQVRNQFLDEAYRREIGRQSFYEAQSHTTNEIETLFGEMEGVQFQEAMNDFWKSIEEMSKQPSDLTARTQMVSEAVSFIERATNIYKHLNEYQVSLNTQISKQVNRINEIGDEIHELNKKIRSEETGPERANDLRDKRNLLLDELGKISKISYKEVANGGVTIYLENAPFVEEDRVFHMGIEPIEQGSPLLKPVWPSHGMDVFNLDNINANNPDATTTANNTDIGSLKGLLLARGDYMGKYTNIPIEPKAEDYGGEDTDEYKIAMNEYEEAVRNYNTKTEPSILVSTVAKFDQLIHGIVTGMNDIMCPNITATWKDGEEIVWKDKSGNIVQGPNMSEDQIAELATQTADSEGNITYTLSILDPKNAPAGMDEEHTQGEALFNRKSTPRYNVKEIENGDGSITKIYVYNKEDPNDNYSLYTLGEIEVNPNIKQNPSLLPILKQGETGDYDMDICKDLVNVWKKDFATLDPNTWVPNTFQEYYISFTEDIANKNETYESIAMNEAATAGELNKDREMQTGVSSNEELSNMIRFQHSYNAALRYVNVIDEMLDHIVNRM